jgi:hypothetical protein
VVIYANLIYRDLPLNVYTLDSWVTALCDLRDPAQVVEVLVDGTIDAHWRVEIEIGSRGAPLHFWNSFNSGGVRSLRFTGKGQAWRVDSSGEHARLWEVRVRDYCQGVEACLGSEDDQITIAPAPGR